ncbi:MAG: AMIN domain-containing protein [Candidatus Latescibacteria bacterium]|nr:AMIN domain-containing protein [Candidatus Latescibacterota bacterium]NIM20997.1 AMIN domain-containing protein [Candidatus Latescibacterota bacterium]NIM65132.1 AMIN domain-containing protein [Candidatus Latescibacterota bacterium]NIO01647.1 AMIN domain-containing protein [Candidatus Latescibacterota bacterium]NIO28164.1 AMIN domain-containing protein [Candidatus Latescibacterota bacterium]
MKKLSFVRRSVIILLLVGAIALASSATGDVPSVISLKMESSLEMTTCSIEKKGEVELQEFRLENPRRVVLDFVGARHQLDKKTFLGDGKFVQRVRTSQFTNSPQEVTRVVFDINEDASYEIARSGNNIVIEFFSGAKPKSSPAETKSQSSPSETKSQVTPGQPTPTQASFFPIDPQAAAPAKKKAEQDHTPKKEPASQVSVPSTAPAMNAWSERIPAPSGQTDQTVQTTQRTPKKSSSTSDESSAPEASIARAWRTSSGNPATGADFSQETGAFSPSVSGVTNRPVTIDVQAADIKSVLMSLSEYSGRNIISGPEVTGEVTAHLKNVPWRQALDIILKSYGFGFREEYGIIRVSTVDQLTEEELAVQAAERKKDDLLPLETRIIPLSFANAEEMKNALQRIVSKRGNIEIEKGSNAMVVTDIKKNIDEVEVMAMKLDNKLQQVEIVAKMVDVDFEASREFGVRWDVVNLMPSEVSVMGDALVDARVAQPVGTFRVGTVRSWGEVLTTIDMLEKENKANIISNPRIVTADNREAQILVGKEIPLIVSDEAGNPITELTKVGIMLKVTPHVNSDNTITMDLHPEISELSAQATVQGGVIISISEADTRVVVSDGETAVIGGLINEVESNIENGVPVLMDIPVLGNLFKFQNETTKKREMIIFVTPKIIGPHFGGSS